MSMPSQGSLGTDGKQKNKQDYGADRSVNIYNSPKTLDFEI